MKLGSQLLISLLLIHPLAQGDSCESEPSEKNPVAFYGTMQAVGNRIHGSNTGKPMQVKGTSFFWSQWSADFWTEEVVDRMIDEWQVEILRAAWGVKDNGDAIETELEQLYTVVDRCIERGCYIIIDWHTHGLEQNVDAAIAFWNKILDERPHYANHPAVLFETYNEPYFLWDGGPDWTAAKKAQEQVLSVIRGRGADNLVILGTPNYSQDVDVATADPVDDPNVAYAIHWYVPNHCEPIWDKIPSAMSNNQALFGSEWGFWDRESWSQCPEGASKEEIASEWMTRLDAEMISWCSWAISDKAGEQSSLFWPESFASTWLKQHLERWADVAPWRQ